MADDVNAGQDALARATFTASLAAGNAGTLDAPCLLYAERTRFLNP